MPATWKRLITTGDNSTYKNSNLVASDLPLATTSAVGGVSIGSGLSVNGSGVLSADSQSGTVQTLSISGNTITLSDSGGSVTVPDLDTQDLSISGRTISLTNGGSVSVPASSSNDFTTARKNKVDFISVTQAVNLDSMESLKDRGESLGEEDERCIVDLLVDQIEFANIILLNKSKEVNPADLKKIKGEKKA